MARILSLSFFALFLFALTSQASDIQASSIVRRSPDPETSDYGFELDSNNTIDEQNDEEMEEANDNVNLDSVTIKSMGEDFTVKLGLAVRLECKVSPRVAVMEWFKDNSSYALGGVLTGAPPNVKIENNDLVVHNITKADLGTYVCMLTGNPAKSVTHTIKLKEAPKIVSTHVTDGGIVAEGMNLTLTCIATGVPKPTLQWSKETEKGNINVTPEMAQFSANSMTITNVNRSHTGNYFCYAINDMGGNASMFSIKVLGKPRVHVHKQAINSAPNIEAILECIVHEEPLSNIRWYKDEKPISETDTRYTIDTSGQNSTLTVKPQTAEEFGVFTCEAENTYGKHRKSIKLVQYPLIDTLEPVNNTTFRWTITSHLPLEQIDLQIKERNEENWRNVSIPIPEVHDHTYKVEYVLDSKNFGPGNYSAILNVRNTAQWSESQDIQYLVPASEAQFIQHASVFSPGGDAVRPATTVFTTVCLYLLTRIF